MSAESDLHAALVAAAGVTDLVVNRIYKYIASPTAELPLIVYERTSSDPTVTIHGGPPIATEVIVSTSAWARTRAQADALADAIELAMAQTGIPTNRFGHYEEQADAHATIIDFQIWEL